MNMKFNPQKIEKMIISLRMEENIIKQIDKLAYKKNISRNEFLTQCINFALQNLSDDSDSDDDEIDDALKDG